MIDIRDFEPADGAGVRKLLIDAFPSAAEADLVERLRADGDSTIELVAVLDGKLAGHILFSPIVAPMHALALAPVSVAPELQGHGIGTALIKQGHARARASGIDVIFVVGDPEYYGRFGYDAAAAAGFESPYSGPYFMALGLGEDVVWATGTVRHAAAFRDLD